MVIGQNQSLNNQYPDLVVERRRIWRDWANGGTNSELYDTRHLPWILMYYRQVWDITLPPGVDPTQITAGMKRAGKKEIIMSFTEEEQDEVDSDGEHGSDAFDTYINS